MKNFQAIYHQTLAVIPIGLNEFAIGIGFGWISPMVKKFLEDPNSEIKPTEEECSWIASLAEFGRAFGPFFSMFLLDTIGRKRLFQIVAFTFLAVWITIFLTRSVYVLCAALFLFGISVGICNSISGVYIGEICSPHVRGTLCSTTVMFFYLAVLIEYAVAIYLPYNTVSLVSLSIVSCCLISTLLLVESPQFLTLKDRFADAEKTLMWLRGTKSKDDVVEEFENIKTNIASEKTKKTSYRKLFSAPANYKSLIIVLFLSISHAASGAIVVFSFISIIIPLNESINSNEFTLIFGVVQLVSGLVCSLVIENFNRRSLTLFSFALFILCHSAATYLYYHEQYVSPIANSAYIIFALVSIYSGFSAIVDAVVHMIRGELFPQSIKPFGASMSIISHSFTGFLTVKIFLVLKSYYGIYMNFLLYTIVSLAAFWFCYFTLPETRGKSLIEIQKSLETKKNKVLC